MDSSACLAIAQYGSHSIADAVGKEGKEAETDEDRTGQETAEKSHTLHRTFDYDKGWKSATSGRRL